MLRPLNSFDLFYECPSRREKQLRILAIKANIAAAWDRDATERSQ